MKCLLLIAGLLLGSDSPGQPTVVVVVGAPGAEEYGEQFFLWGSRWELAAASAGAKCLRIGDDLPRDGTDRERLQAALAAEAKENDHALWLVLIGHGTFDGKEAKFNLRGPDVTAAQLSEWLAPFKRPLAVINCASSSAPFINGLSGPGRVVVAGTKSGYEQNYARFGDHLSAAIADPDADLDKDEQISLLEAFLSASSRVAEFYEQEARLATETALIDDNGDGLGTPAGWFRGTWATRRAKDGASLDGSRARQFLLLPSSLEQDMPPELRTRRDALERAVAKLRDAKTNHTDEDAYYAQLEPLLLELARLYASSEKPAGPHEATPVLEEQSSLKLDSEGKDRALVGEVISTVALAGQLCREFSVSDHGIDMEIEFKDDDGKATGKKLYLQLKSGDSHLHTPKRDGAEIFRIKEARHARYWMEQQFPVMLVIRNSKGEIRWMEVRDWLKWASDNGKKQVRQIVFEGERFDVMSVRRWR